MSHDVRIAISCPDRTGLLAAITGRLFDLGADLGDTSFAVLGAAAEFACVATLPDTLAPDETEAELAKLPDLKGATIAVTPFKLASVHSETGQITHRIEVRGADKPGLVARLAEVFAEFGANIVRLDSEHIPGGGEGDYLIRFEVWLPPARAASCLAAADNTAGSLGLSCKSEAV
ncbi:MAG: ACT domain-containing protein [Alphaproteobacteria bacterium]|nr:ACT domain-containing protein [Alphaproteobacteria bacterium]